MLLTPYRLFREDKASSCMTRCVEFRKLPVDCKAQVTKHVQLIESNTGGRCRQQVRPQEFLGTQQTAAPAPAPAPAPSPAPTTAPAPAPAPAAHSD